MGPEGVPICVDTDDAAVLLRLRPGLLLGQGRRDAGGAPGVGKAGPVLPGCGHVLHHHHRWQRGGGPDERRHLHSHAVARAHPQRLVGGRAAEGALPAAAVLGGARGHPGGRRRVCRGEPGHGDGLGSLGLALPGPVPARRCAHQAHRELVRPLAVELGALQQRLRGGAWHALLPASGVPSAARPRDHPRRRHEFRGAAARRPLVPHRLLHLLLPVERAGPDLLGGLHGPGRLEQVHLRASGPDLQAGRQRQPPLAGLCGHRHRRRHRLPADRQGQGDLAGAENRFQSQRLYKLHGGGIRHPHRRGDLALAAAPRCGRVRASVQKRPSL
mmetsp:Transcript_28734/g.72727  ORF Transcript_28734/g.72727 Transcript_28734/m.72727 type:complete len:329 (-) Transcript_28734:119-1105(-)